MEDWSAPDHDKQFQAIFSSLFTNTRDCLNVCRCFDLLYSYVHAFESLPEATKARLVEYLGAALNTLLDNFEDLWMRRLQDVSPQVPLLLDDRCPAREGSACVGESSGRRADTAVKMYVFLLCHCLAHLKRLDSKSMRVLSKLPKCVSLSSAWKVYVQEEAFYKLLQDVFLLSLDKDCKELTPLLEWLHSMASRDSWKGWRAQVIDAYLTKTALSSMTEVICTVPQAAELLVDIVKTAVSTENQKSDYEANILDFIEKFSILQPRETQSHISTLVKLLECDSYHIRNAAVLAFGNLLVYLIRLDKEPESDETPARVREQLLDILESRALDKINHSRKKVLDEFIRLVNMNYLPRARFIGTLKIARDRLEDQGCYVRKNAALLLQRLVVNNKFSVQSFDSFEEVEAQLQINQDEIQHLKACLDGSFASDEDPENLSQQIKNAEIFRDFLNEYKEMMTILTDCCRLLFDYLKCETQTDVLSAIDALTVLQIAELPAAKQAFKLILPLIWNKDLNVRELIRTNFVSKFLNLEACTEDECAERIFKLIESLSVGESASLEELFVGIMTDVPIPYRLQRHVWMSFKSSPRLSSITMLRYLSRKSENFLRQKYTKLCGRLLTLKHWGIFTEGLVILQNIGYHGTKTEEMIVKAADLLLNSPGEGWHCAAQQFVKFAALSPSSLKHFRGLVLCALRPLSVAGVSEELVSQGFFIAGEVALELYNYGEKLKKVCAERSSLTGKASDLEEITGGAAAKIEMQKQSLCEIQERQVMPHLSLLGCVVPVVAQMASTLGRINSLKLQQATLLTLVKFMSTSESVCRDHLELFLSILRGDFAAEVKCNALIAFGDLTMRHHNLLAPHSQELFNCLRANELAVKKKTLLVLTHLVLNDELKIRGQMADVMLCLLDPQVAASAKTFFSELNLKDKKLIFNCLPNSLSSLLRREDISHEEFCKMTKYVCQLYVKGITQVTAFVEKLCKRLLKTGCQTLNVAFCLSQLNYDDSALRRLLDFKSVWQRLALESHQFQGYLLEIATSNRRINRMLAEELEANLRGESEARRRTK
jgi:condensin complex subunit 1